MIASETVIRRLASLLLLPLVLGPALNRNVTSLPLGFWDGMISLGFLGIMAIAVTGFFSLFPQSALSGAKEGN